MKEWMVSFWYKGATILLMCIQLGSGQAALFLESFMNDKLLSKGELNKIQDAQNLYGTDNVSLFEFDEAALLMGEEASFPLPGDKRAVFKMERMSDQNVWKGRQGGKIRMSLRKVHGSYTGYMYSGADRFAVVGLEGSKLAIVEVDTHFECSVGEKR